MLGWIDWLALALLVLATGFALLGIRRTKRRLAALRAAEAPRMKLARLAHLIENDAEAPERARAFVSMLADHAFDDAFCRQVARAARRAVRAGQGVPALRAQVRADFGPHYGAIVYQAIQAFAAIVQETAAAEGLLPAVGRRDGRDGPDAPQHARAAWDWLRRHPGGGPGGGAPAHA